VKKTRPLLLSGRVFAHVERNGPPKWRDREKDKNRGTEKQMQFVKQFVVEDEGAEVVEWALLVVVLGLAILVGGPSLGSAIKSGLGSIGTKVQTEGSSLGSA
jgi:Flp pilus assembly pilin Flp